MSETYTLRRATIDDVPIISRQRIAMFHDMGFNDDAALERMDDAFCMWLTNKMTSGLYRGWFAVSEAGEDVAGAGLWLNEWIPHPYDPRTVRGYVLNVYTEKAHRKQGLAKRLVSEILDFCRERDIHVVALHASDEGRHIYEALGFAESNEMRIRLL